MKRGKGEWEGRGVIREQRKLILDTETEPFFDLAPYKCQNDIGNLASKSKYRDLRNTGSLSLP